MKKLFLVLCVVIMFFGIVGCPSSDDLAPQAFKSNDVATVAQAGETGNATVPEPATLILLGAGLIGLVGVGSKKFFKKD